MFGTYADSNANCLDRITKLAILLVVWFVFGLADISRLGWMREESQCWRLIAAYPNKANFYHEKSTVLINTRSRI